MLEIGRPKNCTCTFKYNGIELTPSISEDMPGHLLYFLPQLLIMLIKSGESFILSCPDDSGEIAFSKDGVVFVSSEQKDSMDLYDFCRQMNQHIHDNILFWKADINDWQLEIYCPEINLNEYVKRYQDVHPVYEKYINDFDELVRNDFRF